MITNEIHHCGLRDNRHGVSVAAWQLGQYAVPLRRGCGIRSESACRPGVRRHRISELPWTEEDRIMTWLHQIAYIYTLVILTIAIRVIVRSFREAFVIYREGRR